MSPRRRALAAAAALVLLASSQAGCGAKQPSPRTEILLQVDADRELRQQAQSMTLELASGEPGKLQPAAPEVFDLTDEDFRWPASLALLAKPGHEAHAFEVTITVEKGGEPLARGRVRSTFVKQQTLLLKTSLFSACIGKLDCGDDETCVSREGEPECVDALVKATGLPHYEPAAGAGAAGDAAHGGAGAGAGVGDGSAGQSADSGSGADASMPDADAATADAGTDAGVDSGVPTSCVSRGPEQCSNGIDDDCNGDVDCADAACSSMTCAPSGSVTGVLVPDADACPEGFQLSETTINQGLIDQGCSGCSCTTTATQCVPLVYYYASSSDCLADTVTPYTGGTLINKSITSTCSSEPIGDSQGMGTPVAWRVAMNAYPGTCSASGSAAPLAPVWATTMKLCTTNTRGGGCGAGFTCVPKSAYKTYCVQPSAAGCPPTTSPQTWSRGFSDNRSCGSCTCQASGGDCDDVVVRLGHDWGCSTIDGELHGGDKSCSISTYSPPALMAGAPNNASCSATAAVNGSLTETSPLELCCTD